MFPPPVIRKLPVVVAPGRVAFGWVALGWVGLSAGALSGQSIAPVEELDATAMAKAGIGLERDAKEEEVVVVTWGEVRIPLARPVSSCAVAEVPGGKEIIVLAGGVRSSLDLYLVQKDGEFERYETEGGRRLLRSFNDGAGSWPAVEGRHMLLFAFEKGGAVEFRAMDFRGQVFIARALPAKVSGWKVESDPDDGEVRVSFGAAAKALRFRHPLAPRLELRSGLLQFGKVDVGKRSRRMLELTNRGKRPLRLRIVAPSEGFEIVTKPPELLAAGKSVRLRVDFVPTRAGAFTVPLNIFATGVVPEHIVRLRGEGIPPATASKSTGPKSAGPKSAGPKSAGPKSTGPKADGSKPGRSDPKGSKAKSTARPVAPAVLTVEFHPRGDGAVLVAGRLRVPSTSRAVLRTADGTETEVIVDAGGRFGGRLAADAGAVRIGVVNVANQQSRLVPLGAVPRMLTIEGGAAHIRCLPEEAFVLTARSEGDVLRRWRGKTDSKGRRRLPLSILGKRASGKADVPPLTLEITIVVDGKTRSSPRVTVD